MTIDQTTKEAIHHANFARRVRARAFRPDGGGSYTDTVPGGQGYVYVRMLGVSGSALTMARDTVGLASPADDNAPIWIEPDANGLWVISQRRYED